MNGITITGGAILLVLVLFTIYGMKMGFVKAVFDLFSFFFTGILTWFLYPVVASWIIKTPLYKFLNGFILTTLSDNITLEKSLPEFFIKLPTFMKDSVMETSRQAFGSLIESTGEALTVLAINLISIILIFLAVRLVALLLKKYAVKINKIIIIGTVNKILGGIFGFIQGYFLVCLILLIISLFPYGKIQTQISKDLETSYVAGIMLNENTDIFNITQRYNTLKGE